MEIADLKKDMDQRFDEVTKRFTATESAIRQQFTATESAIRQRFTTTQTEIRQHITAEGQRTRRHFDVVAEQMKAERNLSIDQSSAASQQVARLTAANAADHVAFENRLDDHDRRLGQLEKPGS
jgi:predicted transcriptional regulator